MQGVLSSVSGPVIEARFPGLGRERLPKIGELLHGHNDRGERANNHKQTNKTYLGETNEEIL